MVTAEALSQLGFRTVRFTGGEPTLFSNFDEMARPFLDRGLAYRVLTNGINLDHCIDFFTAQPPERFTVSVHTTSQPGEVFGVPVTADELAANRRLLASIAEVEATIVVEDAMLGWNELEETLAVLTDDGVQHVKLLLENSRQVRDSVAFLAQAGRVHAAWSDKFRSLRFTDPRQYSCKLGRKGFPAIELGRGMIYACCVQVGDRPVASGYAERLPITASQAADSIAEVVEHSMKVLPGALPCAAGVVFCPLALSA